MNLTLNHIIYITDSSGSQGTSLRMDSQDSTEVEWGSSRQPSISLREWDIPIEDLKIGQKIGSGQFSTGNCKYKNVIPLFGLYNYVIPIFCAMSEIFLS